MLLWKVVWKDGSASRIYAETKHQIRFEAFPREAHKIRAIVAEVHNACDDRTNPYMPAGLPGHGR